MARPVRRTLRVPFRHSGVECAVFEDGKDRYFVTMSSPPPGPFRRRPAHGQLAFPGSVEIGQRKIEPEDRGPFFTGESLHAELFQLDVGRDLPVFIVSKRLRFPYGLQPDEQGLAGFSTNE